MRRSLDIKTGRTAEHTRVARASINHCPEVIGPPSPQGVVVLQANNCPHNIDADHAKQKDAWYVPAHCPVFATQDANGNATDRDGVFHVGADCRGLAHRAAAAGEIIPEKIVGISIDGLYDVEMQRAHMRSEGANRFSIAVAGLVTVASSPEDNAKFVYGDRVYVENSAKVVRLTETQFLGALTFSPTKSIPMANRPSVGTLLDQSGPRAASGAF